MRGKWMKIQCPGIQAIRIWDMFAICSCSCGDIHEQILTYRRQIETNYNTFRHDDKLHEDFVVASEQFFSL